MSPDADASPSYPWFVVFVWAWGLSAAALVAWGVVAGIWERHAHYSVGSALAVPEAIVGFLATLAVIWIGAAIVWAWQSYRRPLTPDAPTSQRD